MVTSADPNYPKGFRDSQGIEPEPRLGLAWDIDRRREDGAARERRPVPQPARQRERPGRDGAGTHPRRTRRASSTGRWTRCSRSARRARSRIVRAPCSASSATRKTPKSYNYSVGVQRELGWGTVLDVTYAGFQMRNAEMNEQHQPGARRRPLPRRQPAERESAEPDDGEAGRVPASLPRLPGHHHPLALRHGARTTPCRCSSIAATSTACSSPSPTRFGEDRQRRRRPTTPLRPGDGVERRPRRRRRSSTTSSSTTPGTCPNGSRMWDNIADARPARRLAALRRHRVRERRLVRRQHVDDRQLRLHRRRRRHAAEDQRRRALHERQLRPDAGRRRQLPQRRGVQPSDRPRRHRQRAGHVLPAAEDRAVEHVGLQELPARRRHAASSSAGRRTTCSTRSTGRRINTNAQFNPAGEQVNANFGQATAARERARHAGGDPVHLLSHG